MQAVVQRDNHGIHAGIGEQGVVAGMGARDAEFRGGGAGAGAVAAGEGDEVEAGQQAARLRVFADNRSGAEDAKARVHRRQLTEPAPAMQAVRYTASTVNVGSGSQPVTLV